MLTLLLLSATISDIELRVDDRILTSAETQTFLNQARCSCDTSFRVSFDVNTVGEDGSIAVAYGKRCVDSEERIADACNVVWRGSLSGLSLVDFSVSGADLGCSGESNDALIVLVDPLDEDRWQEIGSLELPVDTKGPSPPKNAKVLGGENLAEVIFERPTAEETVSYQVLCEKSGEPVFDTPEEAGFESTQDLCGSGTAVVSRRFVCAEVSGGADSITVLGLENEVTYKFYVVTIDAFKNPSSPASAGEATPAPELDLWEVYKRQGGGADGGHCFVATAAYGDYDDPQVRTLRAFRDGVLKEHAPALIDLYYATSPPLADWIAKSDDRRRIARVLLAPLVAFAGWLR